MEKCCCGDCCWFKYEDIDGKGLCVREKYPWDAPSRCDGQCSNGSFVCVEEMRHHMAVLLQANRYRRDQHVPSIYKMPDPKELGKAIDFAVEYMRVFDEI